MTLPDRRTRPLRRAIQLVQQNPLSALNPRRSVGASVRLPIDVHELRPRSERNARVAELLKEVDLDPRFARRSPRGLSGGERQRIAIARALAAEPELIVLDEPTSALDVLVQARVLDLLGRLRREHGLTYIFITHDLAVVRAIADRVSVFQRGRLVETGTVADIFAAPKSAYTRELIGAIPVVTEEEARLRDEIRNPGRNRERRMSDRWAQLPRDPRRARPAARDLRRTRDDRRRDGGDAALHRHDLRHGADAGAPHLFGQRAAYPTGGWKDVDARHLGRDRARRASGRSRR